MTEKINLSFQQHYRGRFGSILRWHQLDELWDVVKAQPEGWYIYLIGDTLPTQHASAEELKNFITEVDTLLRQEHEERYCGIVYADNTTQPQMIKIFDPNNLGSSCGSSGKVIPPRWLLSRILPETIEDDAPMPMNRKRWWQRLFSN